MKCSVEKNEVLAFQLFKLLNTITLNFNLKK